MRPLRFIALDEDGANLVLAPDVPEAIDNGERFLLPCDDRLRAAARGDVSRLGQLEIELESSLRPRDIQARIRAGDSPEQVAAAAGVRLENVLRYAHPVLQEREKMAEAARAARVRLADGPPAAPLGEFIAEKLTALDADHRSTSWDARRLEDGGWEVRVGWGSGKKRGLTRWWFDVTARSVTPADAETSAFSERPRAGQSMIVAPQQAAQLQSSVEEPPPTAPPIRPRHRALTAVTDVPPAYADLDEALDDDQDEVSLDDLLATDEPVHAGSGSRDHKPRVPSWEDIVFGVRRKRS
ncbi:septation protein SepH [soil metagenome]